MDVDNNDLPVPMPAELPPPPPVPKPTKLSDLVRQRKRDMHTALYEQPCEEIVEELEDIAIEFNGRKYYTIHQLAVKFNIPAIYWRRKVREPRSALRGRIISKVEIIDGESFHEWIMSGKLTDYSPRPERRVRDLEEDMQMSRKAASRYDNTEKES